MEQIQYAMNSKVGPLYLVASAKGLEGVFWRKQEVKSIKRLDPSCLEEKIVLNAVGQLEEYFEGKRKKFNIDLNCSGTPFQKSVWKQLSQIPFGKTVSYQAIAQRIKNPRALRAVGTANGKNPFCIIVPCHRVIAADGGIGGYAGGVVVKQHLLDLECKFKR